MTANDDSAASGSDDLPDDRPTPEGRDAHAAGADDERPTPEGDNSATDESSADESGKSDDDKSDDDTPGDGSSREDDRPDADLDDIDKMEDIDTEVPEENLVDRDKADFDVDAGLLSGTAIHGGTDIPGEHELVDDNPEISEEDGSDSDSEDDDDKSEDDSGDDKSDDDDK